MTGVDINVGVQLEATHNTPAAANFESDILLPEFPQFVAARIRELEVYANAIRELESSVLPEFAEPEHGNSAARTDGWIRELRISAASLIEDIAATLTDPHNREVLRLRAAIVRGERTLDDGALHVLHSQLEQEMLLFFGPLKTWATKSESIFHSFLCAIPDLECNRAMRQIAYDESIAFFRNALNDDQLALATVPGFGVFDIVACGGEAKRLPRHFAYFFPEDEFAPDKSVSRTVVFRNLLTQRFMASGRKLFTRLAPSVLTSWESDRVARSLLLWMKGHDIGHAVCYPYTDYGALHQVFGSFRTGVIAEAVADCYGYLLLTSERALAVSGAEHELGMYCFIGEMLRYIARGPSRYHDSGAAWLELGFLVRHGYVTLRGGRLDFSLQSFHDGMIELVRCLNRSALTGDIEKLGLLLNMYLDEGGEGSRGLAPIPLLLQDNTYIPLDIHPSTIYRG